MIRTSRANFSVNVIMCSEANLVCGSIGDIILFRRRNVGLVDGVHVQASGLGGNFLACRGFTCLPVRFHVCNHAAVTVPFRWPCRHVRYRRSAVHFASVSGISLPPICFGHCSVDTGIRKTVPFQIYHTMAVVSCCAYIFGAGKICVVYQI